MHIIITLFIIIGSMTGQPMALAQENEPLNNGQEIQEQSESSVDESPSDVDGVESTHNEEGSFREMIPEGISERAEQAHFFLDRFRANTYENIFERRQRAYNTMQSMRDTDGFSEETSIVLVFISLAWWQVLSWIFGSVIIFYVLLAIIAWRILSAIFRSFSRRPDWDM